MITNKMDQYNKSLQAYNKKLNCIERRCKREVKALEDAASKIDESKLKSLREKLKVAPEKEKPIIRKKMQKFDDNAKEIPLRNQNKCMSSKCAKEARESLKQKHLYHNQNCILGSRMDCRLGKETGKLLQKKHIKSTDYDKFDHILKSEVRKYMKL
jgi:hypothetical protein